MGMMNQAQQEQAQVQRGMAPAPPQHVSSATTLAMPEKPIHEMAKEQAGAGMGGRKPELNVTDEEQTEYERASEALGDMLYRNEKTADAIEQMILPEDKMGSIIQAGILLMKDLDERLDLDLVVVSQITEDLVGGMFDIAEAKGMQYTGREAQQVLSGVWEGVMMMFGGTEETLQEDYDRVTEGLGEEEIEGAKASYQQLLDEGQGQPEMMNG